MTMIVFKEANDVGVPAHAYLTVGFILRRFYPAVLKSHRSLPNVISTNIEGADVITWGWWVDLNKRGPLHE